MPDEQVNTPGAASRRGTALRWLGTLLSLGLLAYLISLQGWREFFAVVARLPAGHFWLALGLMLLSRAAVGLRWYVLLRAARAPLGFWQCLRLTLMGLFASNFLPSTVGGDLVRLVGAVGQRVSPGTSAASLLLDRLIGMAGMTSLAPVGLAILLRAQGAAALPFSATGALTGISRLPGYATLRRRGRKITRSVTSSAALWLRRPASLLLALLCTYAHMLFTFLLIALLLAGLGQPLPLWWIAGLWSLSYFISLAPVSINGLGLQELSISMLYSHFGGVSTEVALAMALVVRVLQMLASLPGVLFLPDILRLPAGGAVPPQDAQGGPP